MAIRLRTVDGVMVALCAVESDPMPDDLYLDDAHHYALAAKFSEDWKGETSTGGDPIWVALMETQKVRDAKEEVDRWQRTANMFKLDHPGIENFGWEEIRIYWDKTE